MRRFILFSAAVSTALVLSACSSQGVSVTEASGTGDVADAVASPSSDSGGVSSTSAAYGDTVTWDDGLELTISEGPITVMPEHGAADSCLPGDSVATFEVELRNGTGSTYAAGDAAGLDIVVSHPDGTEANGDQVFDGETGSTYDIPTLRDGKSGAATIGICKEAEDVEILLVADFSIYNGEDPHDRPKVTYSASGTESL